MGIRAIKRVIFMAAALLATAQLHAGNNDQKYLDLVGVADSAVNPSAFSLFLVAQLNFLLCSIFCDGEKSMPLGFAA